MKKLITSLLLLASLAFSAPGDTVAVDTTAPVFKRITATGKTYYDYQKVHPVASLPSIAPTYTVAEEWTGGATGVTTGLGTATVTGLSNQTGKFAKWMRYRVTTANIAIKKAFVTSLPAAAFANGYVGVWIRCSKTSAVPSVSVFFKTDSTAIAGSSNISGYYRNIWTASTTNAQNQQWYLFVYHPLDASVVGNGVNPAPPSDPRLNTININAIELRSFGITDTVTFDIGPVIYLYKQKPVIEFTFDDGNTTDYTHAFPLLASYGLVGSSFLIGDFVDGTSNINSNQALDMASNGWTFAVHGNTAHNASPLSGDSAAIYADIAENSNMLTTKSIYCTPQYAYPGGVIVPASYGAIKANGLVASYTTEQNLRPWKYDDNLLNVNRMALHTGTTVAQYDTMISQSIYRGASLVFLTHKIVASGPSASDILQADFDSVVVHAAARIKSGQAVGGLGIDRLLRMMSPGRK